MDADFAARRLICNSQLGSPPLLLLGEILRVASEETEMSAAPAAAAPSAAAAPAASADPDRVWFYLSPATGAQCGPVTPGDIADLLIDRDINSSTLG